MGCSAFSSSGLRIRRDKANFPQHAASHKLRIHASLGHQRPECRSRINKPDLVQIRTPHYLCGGAQFYVTLRKLIFQLQACSQRIQKSTMPRFYMSINLNDVVLIRHMSRDATFHDRPHPFTLRRLYRVSQQASPTAS